MKYTNKIFTLCFSYKLCFEIQNKAFEKLQLEANLLRKKKGRMKSKNEAQKKPRDLTRLKYSNYRFYVLTNFKTFSNCSCLVMLELSNSRASLAFTSGESSLWVSM